MKIELSNGLEVKAVMWLNITVAEVQERAFPICLFVQTADFKPLTLKTDTVDEDGMKMIIYKMQTILPVALYPLYMQFGWRKKRMADIGQTAKFVLMDMMNGRIKTIKDTIRNDCKMVFYSDGRIEYLDRGN